MLPPSKHMLLGLCGTCTNRINSALLPALAMLAAVEKYALSHGLKRVPGPDPQFDDICFGQAPSHDDLEALSSVFPSMEVQFDQVWEEWKDGKGWAAPKPAIIPPVCCYTITICYSGRAMPHRSAPTVASPLL